MLTRYWLWLRSLKKSSWKSGVIFTWVVKPESTSLLTRPKVLYLFSTVEWVFTLFEKSTITFQTQILSAIYMTIIKRVTSLTWKYVLPLFSHFSSSLIFTRFSFMYTSTISRSTIVALNWQIIGGWTKQSGLQIDCFKRLFGFIRWFTYNGRKKRKASQIH